MFELLALLGVLIAGAVVVAMAGVAFVAVKFVFKVLLLPLAAVFVIVKVALLFAVGAAFVGMIVAIVVPIVICAVLVAVPVAVISAIV